MMEYLKASYRFLVLLKTLDLSDYRLFRISSGISNRNYILNAFIRQNNHLMVTDEQLSLKLDQFLEKHKNDFLHRNRN